MLSKWQYLFSFIIFVLYCLVNSYGYTCSKAQVERIYTFHGIFKHILNAPVKIAWFKDGQDVSHCIPGLPCSDTNEEKTTTTLKDLGKENYEFQLVVHNITRNDAGLWSLVYFGPAKKEYPAPIFVCQLKFEGKNESEVETIPVERVPEINTDPNNERKESGELVDSNIFVLIGSVGGIVIISVSIVLYIKYSKDPYQRVAEAKEITKKSTSNDEKSTRCPNIVSEGWSKFNHLIAKICSSTKKASSVSDDYNRYTSIQCNQESHVTFPASEL